MPEWVFPLSPIAASRPRISKHGAYFAGPYKIFREAMIELVPEVIGDAFFPYEMPIRVDVEFYCKLPKKTKLLAPRADIDNYLKAAFDCLNGKLWEDDRIIHSVYATKQWAPRHDDGYFTVGVEELEI